MSSKTEIFIEKAKKVHGDRYDYSKVEYIWARAKVCIVCIVHGAFEQSPNNHLNGNGCKQCGIDSRADAQRSSTEDFIKKAEQVHGIHKYSYDKVKYTESNKNVVITCILHGEFNQRPNCHLMGRGCKHCGDVSRSDARRLSTEDFITKAEQLHGSIYNYNSVIYTTSFEKIVIICIKHGPFHQAAGSHLMGAGCPRCNNKTEGKLFDALRAIHPTTISQFKAEWCMRTRMLPFDFCIPENKVLIELDGPQHFKQVYKWTTPESQFENDKYKEARANSEYFSVVRITQNDVWFDTYDWLAELTAAIDEIKALPVGEVKNIYLCKNGEYNAYQ